ncbi:MAG TPA: class I SAM-dependent methyltransferase [Actinomycetota bacterium]|nr:class I SAM-dependent methyltransferase [Actinomycetota bacterium]
MPSAIITKPCVVCARTARETVLWIDTWHVARCYGCGTHTLWPEPDHVQMEEFDDGSGYEGAFVLREQLIARHHSSLGAVERFVGQGRLLDVGCGLGLLLETARARGWQAVGVDPSPFSVAKARELGFEAHLGMLEDVDLPAGSFDAIALLQVVEHLPDPRPLLAACHLLLRPGGALLVATPNPASALARAKRERFNYWIPPVHVAWYTPDSLSQLLRGNGFMIGRQSTWSARSPSLHDGVDIVSALPLGDRLPYRAKRALGGAIASVSDAIGRGSIVEHIALRGEGDA